MVFTEIALGALCRSTHDVIVVVAVHLKPCFQVLIDQ